MSHNCKKLAYTPIPKVQIGLIGLGARGIATVSRYMSIPETEIVAISDLRQPNLQQAISLLNEHGKPTPRIFCGEDRWMHICEDRNVNLVIICTDWNSHADMATYAMKCGKHVALEVPAAMTVRECWQLVHTAEETRRHCIMLENCCYDTFHLGVMGMKMSGIFGDIHHCEGAYIHDLRASHPEGDTSCTLHKGWMQCTTEKHGGNPYPTHGLGPICQLLDINHGDRLVRLTSMTATNCISNTLISTQLGRTILLQFDETTPRPYSRLQTLCGTNGYVQKYPHPTLQLDGGKTLSGRDAIKYVESFQSEEMKAVVQKGYELDVPNVMNYAMDRRLTDSLLQGNALDMDVYDAALWSCVTELSARSAELGGAPVEIPDFTGGNWK